MKKNTMEIEAYVSDITTAWVLEAIKKSLNDLKFQIGDRIKIIIIKNEGKKK